MVEFIEPEDSEAELGRALRVLSYTAARLRRISQTIALLTVMHVVALLSAMVVLSTMTVPYTTFLACWIGEYVILLAAIAALMFQDRLEGMGNSLFQEISDEVEWHVREERTGQPTAHVPSARVPPRLEVRLVLRQFINASEMPFFRGTHSGGRAYLVLNIGLAAAATTFFVLKFHP